MGVQGLWQLLESTGRPVTLESLEGKILAVDVSLWLHQAMRGMRDEEGNVVNNAHLLVLFNRICKLLFYRIKPIFVFDGSAPQLKKQTLVARRQRREVASSNLKGTANKVLKNYMKTHALKTVVGSACELPEAPARVPLNRGNGSQEPDLFQLPPMPPENSKESEEDANDAEDMWAESQEQLAEFASEEDLGAMDIDSEVFKALPLEVQHELITVMREKGKRSSWQKLSQLPKQAGDFSNYQLSKLLGKGRMTQRLDQIRKEMNVQNTGAVASFLDYETNLHELHAGRIMSEDTEHYVLVKNKPSGKTEDEEASSGASQETSSNAKLEEKISKDAKKSETQVMDSQNSSNASWDVDLTQGEESSVLPDASKEISNAVKSFFAKKSLPINPGAEANIKALQSDSKVSGQKSVESRIRKISDSDSKEDEIEIISNSEASEAPSTDNVEIVDVKPGTRTKDMQSFLTSTIDQLIFSELTDSNKEGKASDDKTLSEHAVKSKGQDKKQFNERQSESDDIMIVGEVEGTSKDNKKQPANMQKPPTNQGKMPGPFPFMSFMMDKLIASALSDNLEVSDNVLSKRGPSTENGGRNIQQTETVGGSSDESDDDFIEVPISSTDEPNPETLTPPVQETKEVSEAPAVHSEKVGTVDHVIEVEEEGDIDEKPNDKQEAEDNEIESEEVAEKASEKDDKQDSYDEGEDIVMETAEADERESVPRANAVQEWAGMDVQNPLQLQEDLESERLVLATERHKQERVALSITDVMYAESKELLQMFGIPFIVSPQEAEAQCAYLDLTKQTHGTITDDSDIWLFGGCYVYKNFFTKGKDVEFFRSNDLEKQLVLTRDKLIQLSYLLGSDYTVGVQGVGGITAMELLSEFPGQGLDGLKQFKEWWDSSQKQLMPPVESVIKGKLRKVTVNPGFPNPHVREAYLQPVVDESKEKFSWGSPDLDLLREFATSKLGWNRSKVDEMLLPVLRKLNEKQVQSKISHFFPVNHNEPRPIKSRRLQRVLKKFRNSSADEEEDVKSKKRKQAVSESTSDDDYKPTSPECKEEQHEVRRSGRVTRRVIPSIGEKNEKKKSRKENKVGNNVSVIVASEEKSAKNDSSKNAGSNGAIEVAEENKSSKPADTGQNSRRGKGRLGVKGKGKLLVKKSKGNMKKSASGPQLSESSSNDSD